MDLRSAALSYLELGIPVIPVDPKAKKPAVRWKEYQQRLPTPQEASQWQWSAIALLTGLGSGYAVVDCDTMEAAEYWNKWRPETKMRVKTRRGVHFYYRCQGDIRCSTGVPLAGDLKYDVRGIGGYVLAPPTNNYKMQDGFHYPEKLPRFNPAWSPERDRIKEVYNPPCGVGVTKDGLEAHVLRTALEEAPHGRNRAGFRAAVQLRRLGYTYELALGVLVRYQQSVENMRPEKYTLSEAMASLQSAYSYTGGSHGNPRSTVRASLRD